MLGVASDDALGLASDVIADGAADGFGEPLCPLSDGFAVAPVCCACPAGEACGASFS